MTDTRHTPELADEVVFRMANGESLRRICRDPHMPPESTVRSWGRNDTGGFAGDYHQAQLSRVDCLADELLCVAYDQEMTRRRGG